MIDAKSGASLAATAALLALANAAPTAVAASGTGHIVACYGINSCKGQSDCKSGNHACKGQNDCKGQGFKDLTKEQCRAQHGSFTPPK